MTLRLCSRDFDTVRSTKLISSHILLYPIILTPLLFVFLRGHLSFNRLFINIFQLVIQSGGPCPNPHTLNIYYYFRFSALFSIINFLIFFSFRVFFKRLYKGLTSGVFHRVVQRSLRVFANQIFSPLFTSGYFHQVMQKSHCVDTVGLYSEMVRRYVGYQDTQERKRDHNRLDYSKMYAGVTP